MTHLQKNILSNEQTQDLISCIYDAAVDETQWSNVLQKLTVSIGAEQSNLRLLDSESKNVRRVYTHNKDPYWTQAYIDYYVNKDPWLDILASPKPVNVTCTHQLIADKEYQNMGFYHDFIAPQEVFYAVGGIIKIDKESSCYFAFQRARNKGGFSTEYRNLFNMLASHIKKAVLINTRLQNAELQQHLFSDALNQISSPLLLVDKSGSVLFINALAEQLIKNNTTLTIKNNRLSIKNHAENKKLQSLIYQATLTHVNGVFKQGGAMRYSCTDSPEAVSILVTPVNPARINQGTLSDETALILLNTDNSPPSLTVEILKDLYNLSSAEARLTIALCQGFTLDEIAQKQCRSKNTLRAQLRTCFKKTGVSRQAELIRLVSTGPAADINTYR